MFCAFDVIRKSVMNQFFARSITMRCISNVCAFYLFIFLLSGIWSFRGYPLGPQFKLEILVSRYIFDQYPVEIVPVFW